MNLPWRLALVIALLLFLFFGEPPQRSRFWSAFFDAGHTALFGVIALVVRHWLVARGHARRAGGPWLSAFVITVMVGAATEVLQTLHALGDPSLTDLLRDTAGAAAFLLIAWGFTSAQRHRAAAVAVAAVLFIGAGWTLVVTSASYVARDRAYPTLFALDGTWWEREFIELEGNRLTAGTGPGLDGSPSATRLARLDLTPRLYSGIAFDEPYPDWRGREALSFTIVSDLDAPLTMAIRVHDAAHDQRYRDRFNRRLTIAPGVNQVRIPIEEIRNAPDRRQMDLRRIRGILLFAYGLKKPAHVFLGPLRLE